MTMLEAKAELINMAPRFIHHYMHLERRRCIQITLELRGIDKNGDKYGKAIKLKGGIDADRKPAGIE